MQATLNMSHLRAASFCSSDKDVRYYLNGVFVEVRATETRIVATNGECAAVLRDVVESGVQDELPDVIIPNEAVKQVLAQKSADVTLRKDGEHWELGGVPFKPVDGTYPPHRRILPTSHSGEAAQFSVELLSRFLKIAKALGCKSQPIIRHNGTGGAQVQIYGCDDEFVGVIMPLRAFTEKYPDTGLVQWGPQQPAKAKTEDFSDLV